MGITCLSPDFLFYEMALVCTCRAGARIQGAKAGSTHMQVAGVHMWGPWFLPLQAHVAGHVAGLPLNACPLVQERQPSPLLQLPPPFPTPPPHTQHLLL